MTPRQHDDDSYGIFELMFMWRIANGRAAEAVEADFWKLHVR